MKRIGVVAASVIVAVMLSFSAAKAELATSALMDAPDSVKFHTVGGNLVLKKIPGKYYDRAFILLNGKKIFDPKEVHVTVENIFHLTQDSKPVDVVLIEVDGGGSLSPELYSLINIKKDKSFRILKDFAWGVPKVKQKGNVITLVFPQKAAEPDEVFVYKNGHLTKTLRKKSEEQTWSELYDVYKQLCVVFTSPYSHHIECEGSNGIENVSMHGLRILPNFKKIGLNRQTFDALCRESCRTQKPLTLQELKAAMTEQK